MTIVTSPHCPDCHGVGFVVGCGFAVDCQLCKANRTGSNHISLSDLMDDLYMKLCLNAERDAAYWAWLKYMVDNKHIDPDYEPK